MITLHTVLEYSDANSYFVFFKYILENKINFLSLIVLWPFTFRISNQDLDILQIFYFLKHVDKIDAFIEIVQTYG